MLLAKHRLELFCGSRNTVPTLADDWRSQLGGVTKLFCADPDPVKLTVRRFRSGLPHAAAKPAPIVVQEVRELLGSVCVVLDIVGSTDRRISDGRMQPIQEPEVPVAGQYRRKPLFGYLSV